MRLAKHLLAVLICTLLCLPAVPAQALQQQPQATAADVTIIIQQDKVRFTAQKAVAEMRLQVFNQAGESVYDSGAIEATEVNWPLQALTGEALKSGLYAYTLSIKELGKEAGAAEARLRRGHFIVDRAKDRDGADKLWVTSQNESGIGTELTVAKDEVATIAGAAISERIVGQRAEITDRDAAGRTVEAEAQSQPKADKSAAAAPAATVGRIAKFTTATAVGDSVITELNGNIGIGTTNPTSNLEVNGTLDLKTGGSGGELYFHTPAAETGLSILGTSRADIRFDGTTLKLVAGPVGGPPPPERGIAINTTGNVGIGTNTPESKLDVVGTTLLRPGGTGGVIQFGNPNGETGMSIVGARRADVRFDGSSLKLAVGPVGNPPDPRNGVVINASGNVGIGTLTPATKLHVESSGSTEMTIKSTDERAILALDNGLSHPIRYVWTLESGVGGTYTSLFGIYNRNVGKPGLTIDGNLLVSVKALQITGGADFAENFDVRAPNNLQGKSATGIQPGMVVAIDPANPGKLSLSRRAYDHRVAGIISGAGDVKPGMMMGQTGTLADGKHPVALSGRVYAWVDATHGAIRPGDLLTTSPTPGHAMKATNPAKAQGAIIGKAMTGLKAGKGLVLVLVTLQ
ncbi:MAG: hypothetical protein ABIU20_09965 [Blastocatellia bacterium]